MEKPFRFKHFDIYQDACAMKINTDGVLLGAWSSITEKQNALDIGTGTGLIALMLAQRNSELKVDAVEIDNAAFVQAFENFRNSTFTDRLQIFHTPIQDYARVCLKKYDLIISNPPFFKAGTLARNHRKAQVRHTIQLPHDELLQSVDTLLAPNGHFDIILPYTEGNQFIDEAIHYRLFPSKITEVYTKENKPIERILISFSKKNNIQTTNQLIIHNSYAPKDYTEAFRTLTKDFYIFM